jgi:hypothetical protein
MSPIFTRIIGIIYRLYIDSSVLNSYFEADSLVPKTSRLGIETQNFFKKFDGIFLIPYISTVVIDEIEKAPPEKYENMKELIRKYNIITLQETENAYNLAEDYIKARIFSSNSRNDAKHVAITTINRLNAIVSHNKKHIVKPTMYAKIAAFNAKIGYPPVYVIAPDEVS